MKIPESISDYLYATCSSPDVTVDNKIMPSRSDTEPDGFNINVRKCLRGVDVMFLSEAVNTRAAIEGSSYGLSYDSLLMDGNIKSSRLTNIDSCISSMWNVWAEKSHLNLSYSGTHYPNGSVPDLYALKSVLMSGIGFSSAVGTRVASGANFNNLVMNDMLNLFKDMKKKQCCIVTMNKAKVDGTNKNQLSYYSEVAINKTSGGPYHNVLGPTYASTVTVNHIFPQCAAGSRVMLFAAAGYQWMLSDDYPRSQQGGFGECLVPTDGMWHTVGSDGKFSANINAASIRSNIMSACNLQAIYKPAPDDSDPESQKSRQSLWIYYLSDDNGFVGIVDIEHTNIVDTAI